MLQPFKWIYALINRLLGAYVVIVRSDRTSMDFTVYWYRHRWTDQPCVSMIATATNHPVQAIKPLAADLETYGVIPYWCYEDEDVYHLVSTL